MHDIQANKAAVSDMNREKLKKEAVTALGVLIQKYGLWPGLKDHLTEGEIFCLAKSFPQTEVCYAPLGEDETIGELVCYFEKDYSAFVYLCVESNGVLYIFYVPKSQEEWKAIRPKLNSTEVFVAKYFYKEQNILFGNCRLEHCIGNIRHKN